jgi:hypothetical protein
MATTHYRGYRIWHDRTQRKYFAVIWPPGPPLTVLKIISATPREGEHVLLRRVRAFVDVEEARKRQSSATSAKANSGGRWTG